MSDNELTPEEQAELAALEAQEQEEKDADKVEAESKSDDEHSGDELAKDPGETLDDTEVPDKEPKPLDTDGTVLDTDAATPRDLRKSEEDEEQKRRRLAREETDNARARYLDNRPNDLIDSNV